MIFISLSERSLLKNQPQKSSKTLKQVESSEKKKFNSNEVST